MINGSETPFAIYMPQLEGLELIGRNGLPYSGTSAGTSIRPPTAGSTTVTLAAGLSFNIPKGWFVSFGGARDRTDNAATKIYMVTESVDIGPSGQVLNIYPALREVPTKLTVEYTPKILVRNDPAVGNISYQSDIRGYVRSALQLIEAV